MSGRGDRLNRLLMLMQLQLNDLADEASYAAHNRDWLHARGGHVRRAPAVDRPRRLPSLRA